mmetsp:Transcript_28401/g.85081  ORF Transcript_28401/g.85081 Transcript_28401/m.85081 type:complete len:211 (+) Transcript_28401:8635-9267(+)
MKWHQTRALGIGAARQYPPPCVHPEFHPALPRVDCTNSRSSDESPFDPTMASKASTHGVGMSDPAPSIMRSKISSASDREKSDTPSLRDAKCSMNSPAEMTPFCMSINFEPKKRLTTSSAFTPGGGRGTSSSTGGGRGSASSTSFRLNHPTWPLLFLILKGRWVDLSSCTISPTSCSCRMEYPVRATTNLTRSPSCGRWLSGSSNPPKAA